MSKNKRLWEELGQRDPYYAVATIDEFRSSNIHEESKDAFFRLGREHWTEVWNVIAESMGPQFQPKVGIDYGCGVGRVLIPIAKHVDRVVGVDISKSMLEEARRNAESEGLFNIECQDVEQFAAAEAERYDLVHSFIVLQHIPLATGYRIIDTLTGRLSPGGAGMIQVTYRCASSFFPRLRSRMYRDVPGLHRAMNAIRGKDFPFMPVYEYDLGRVRDIIHNHGCEIFREIETDHGFHGKMFFFRKAAE